MRTMTSLNEEIATADTSFDSLMLTTFGTCPDFDRELSPNETRFHTIFGSETISSLNEEIAFTGTAITANSATSILPLTEKSQVNSGLEDNNIPCSSSTRDFADFVASNFDEQTFDCIYDEIAGESRAVASSDAADTSRSGSATIQNNFESLVNDHDDIEPIAVSKLKTSAVWSKRRANNRKPCYARMVADDSNDIDSSSKSTKDKNRRIDQDNDVAELDQSFLPRITNEAPVNAPMTQKASCVPTGNDELEFEIPDSECVGDNEVEEEEEEEIIQNEDYDDGDLSDTDSMVDSDDSVLDDLESGDDNEDDNLPLPRLRLKTAYPSMFIEQNDAPEDETVYEAKMEIDGDLKKTKWSRWKPAAGYVLPCSSGPKATLSPEAESLKSVEQVIRRIITLEILDNIVKHTNAYAKSVTDSKIAAFAPAKEGEKTKRCPKAWKPIDAVELWAYFGALYYMGAKGLSHRGVDELLGHDGREVHLDLLEAFTRDRFREITSFLRFYDKGNDKAGKRENRRRKFKQLLDPIVANCRKLITPSDTLSVNETFLSLNDRVRWRKSLKYKPNKPSLKFLQMCDAASGAMMDTIAYVSNDNAKRKCTRLVLDLARPYAKSGRTIVTNCFHTSPTLAAELWKMGLYSVGAVQANRSGIPKAFADLDLQTIYKLEPKSKKKKNAKEKIDDVVESLVNQEDFAKPRSAFVFQGYKTLVKYHPTMSKATMILSTAHHSPKISNDEKRKPEIVYYYNQRKHGVDLLDRRVKHNSTKRPSRSWPMKVFYWALDVAATQASIVFRMANRQFANSRNNRKPFINELWPIMMREHQQNRRLAAAGSVRAKKLARLEDALSKLQRNRDTNRSPTMSQSKSKVATAVTPVKRDLAAAKRRLIFDKSTAGPTKRTKSEGNCHVPVCKQARRNAYIRCQVCNLPVCPEHRVTVDRSNKEYRCIELLCGRRK